MKKIIDILFNQIIDNHRNTIYPIYNPKISKEEIKRSKVLAEILAKSYPKLTPTQKRLRKWVFNILKANIKIKNK